MFDLFAFFKRGVKKFVESVSKNAKPENVIEIRDLHKSFDRKKVLDGIDVTLGKNEILAIIGPSGCGKSTILRLIIGLFAPTSGDIIVNGRSIIGLDKDQMIDIRKHIGMVFQSSALFDSLSVGENVAFGLREHTNYQEAQIRKIVSEKLKLVGLEGVEELMPSELSGGMQKRVSLARALATEPEIILYDEPTTGLDPITALAIEDLILDIHKKLGTSAIVVTHMMSTVYKIADRIIMLHNGKIIDAGTPEEVQRTNDQVVRQFVTGKVS